MSAGRWFTCTAPSAAPRLNARRTTRTRGWTSARTRALRDFTATLQEMGFEPEGTTWRGHQHRWCRGAVSLDVLIPRWLAPDSPARRTVTGASTLESPGLQQAVERAEDVAVRVMGRVGVVRRPNLLGALVAKAAALEIVIDEARRRHIQDFVTLATLIRPGDDIAAATRLDRERIANMLGRLLGDASWKAIDGGVDGIERLKLALDIETHASRPADRRPAWERR